MNSKTILLIAALMLATPVSAKWTATPADAPTTIGGTLTVTPPAGWNRLSKKPIKKGELWSLDGPLLNKLEFVVGLSQGEPLALERNKKREPLPKFAADMKASDVADIVERTIRITEGAPDFVTETVEPADFAGQPGFRLVYHYTVDDLTNRAEARGAVIGGKLYLITFTAPSLYYFDTGLPRAVSVMTSAKVA